MVATLTAQVELEVISICERFRIVVMFVQYCICCDNYDILRPYAALELKDLNKAVSSRFPRVS